MKNRLIIVFLLSMCAQSAWCDTSRPQSLVGSYRQEAENVLPNATQDENDVWIIDQVDPVHEERTIRNMNAFVAEQRRNASHNWGASLFGGFVYLWVLAGSGFTISILAQAAGLEGTSEH